MLIHVPQLSLRKLFYVIVIILVPQLSQGAEPKLSAGLGHNMALSADGIIYTWGRNDSGQLGNGSFQESAYPIRVPGMDGSSDIAAGGFHSVARRFNRVWTWGDNSNGQLGNESNIDSPTPELHGIATWPGYKIGAGYAHTLIERKYGGQSSGSFSSFGSNNQGELGLGTFGSNNSGGVVCRIYGSIACSKGLTASAMKLDGGQSLSALLTDRNDVYTWGINYDGSLGTGSTTSNYSLTPIQSIVTDVADIAVGEKYILAVKLDGSVWSWGNNRNYYYLGRNDYTRTPGPIPGLTNVKQVATGGSCSTALKQDGTVWAWGSGYSFNEGHQVQIPLSNIEQISGKGGFLAMESNGSVWQWNCGQIPTQVPGENGVGLLRLIDSADVSVTMSDSSDPVLPGDPVVLSALIVNDGPDEASGVIATITLPTDVSYVSTAAEGWTCNESNLVVTCSLPLLTPSASSMIDITYNSPAGSQELISSAIISTDSLDPLTTNNTDQESTVVNTLPSIGGAPVESVNQDEEYTFTPTITGTDLGELLTYSIIGQPQWASFDSANGTLSGVPSNDDVGNYAPISIAVSDTLATVSLPSFDITVVNVNDPPTIGGAPSSIATEDSAYEFSPSYEDIDVGDTLNFNVKGLPAWANFNATTGMLSGIPGNEDVGVTSTLEISVSDGNLVSAPLVFDVAVVNTNDAPAISGNPPGNVNQGEAYSFVPATNEQDIGDVLTFSMVNKPSWIEIDVTTGQVTGTPTNSHVGTYQDIVISVSDGTELAALTPFDLVVVNVNDAPSISGVAPPQAIEDATYSFVPTTSDPDAGDILSFSVTGMPLWAQFDVKTGRLFGTPSNDDVNSLSSVVISVTDGVETDSLASFDITVLNTNDAPSIAGVPLSTVLEDTFYSYVPEATDVDLGNSLVFSISNKPSWALFNLDTGELSGTPKNEHVGNSSEIIVSVSDGTAFRTLPAFTITVLNQNDLPVISGVPPTPTNEDSPFEFLPTASDIDVGSVLEFSIDRMPDWASFEPDTGRLSGTPGNEDAGQYLDIVISVTDGIASAVLSPFDIFVRNVNDAPTINGTPGSTALEDVVYSFTPAVVDVDPNDNLIFSVLGQPSWTSFDTSTGALEGTPDDSVVGQISEIVISVNDGVEIRSLSPFNLEVTGVNDNPSGEILIRGDAIEYQTLQVSNNFTDADGVGIISLQWFRGDTPIDSATSNNYQLTQLDVGKTIRVVAAYLDGQGTDEVVSSLNTDAVVNVNDLPVISGQPLNSVVQGEKYSFIPSVSDEDADDLLVFSIEGQPDWASFDTSTGNLSGVPNNDAVGKLYTIIISVEDSHSSVSLPKFNIRVTNVNDAPAGTVMITGMPLEDELLSIDQGISDADGIGVFRYQWLRSGIPVEGATAETYLLSDIDVGQTIAATVAYKDGHGNEERISSSATNSVLNINDFPRGSLDIIGAAHEGVILSFSETLEDDDGMGEIDIQWLRDGTPVEVIDGTQYVLSNDDVNAVIQLRARYVDDHGSSEHVFSQPTAAVGNINDSPTGRVEISGLNLEGQMLVVSSSLYDPDGIAQISWQWLRNGAPLADATEDTYLLSNDDVNSLISVRATYTDEHGTVERVDSLPLERIVNVNEAPVLKGTPALQATPGIAYLFVPTFSDNDPEDSLSFSVQGLPEWAVLDFITGIISGTPSGDDAGSQTEITLSVSDGYLTTNLSTFALTVSGSLPEISAASVDTTLQPDTPEQVTPAVQEIPAASGDSGGGALSPLLLLFLIANMWVSRYGLKAKIQGQSS